MDSNSSRTIYERHYVDFTQAPSSQITDLRVSTWSRQFLAFTLPHTFPFYGHPVTEILIWTTGYLTLPSSQGKVVFGQVRSSVVVVC